jgi:hypothetical protein
MQLRVQENVSQWNEQMLVVGVAVAHRLEERIIAWQSLLEQVSRQTGQQPLPVRVIALQPAMENRPRVPGHQADLVLGLVARHPLLEHRQLAALLDTSATRVGRLVGELTAAGWVRSFQPATNPPVPLWPGQNRPRQVSLVELTPAGRREAARRLLLPASLAVRHHGLLGSQKDRRFACHLAHTLGANAVFVAFVEASRRLNGRGQDDALEEWRSAAACARGRFRPDGYGCYRRGQVRFGFFLEFDRGTEKPREHAAKLATYYRFRDSGGAARDYTGLPVLLVVATSELAEGRFAEQAHLAAQRHSGQPLPVFLTTTSRIRADPDGVLGAIWRGPGWGAVHHQARGSWLPPHPKTEA